MEAKDIRQYTTTPNESLTPGTQIESVDLPPRTDILPAIGIRTEETRIQEVRKNLETHTSSPSSVNPLSVPAVKHERLAGFRQKPLKVLRNFFAYPDLPKIIAISGSTIAITTSTLFFNPSFLTKSISFAGLALMSAEFVGYYLRTRKVSRFLTIRDMKPTQEKLLTDGTKVGLDDTIGEFHFSPAGLYGLIFQRNKMKRTLTIGESTMRGLVDLAEKIEKDDPAYKAYIAFKGTSTFIPPRKAASLGFETGKPGGFAASVYPIAIPFDKIITGSPLGTKEVCTAWISRQGLVKNKSKFEQELARIKAALGRRS